MTAPVPTITVLLDDGTGTYPTDVTSRVSLSAGVGISGHGRTDEFSQAAATSFSCTLNNNDGGLTGSGTGFGVGGFGLGPFGGTIAVAPGQGIRYIETKGSTTVNVFTGRISEAPVSFTGPGKQSSMAITAVDPLSSLSRRPMRSMLEQEILLDGPTAYYTLAEPEGSTSAGDTSGNGAPSLQVTGTGPAVVFGNGTGPADGLTAAQFAATSTDTAQYLSAASPAGFTTGGSWSLEAFMDWTGLASTSMTIQLDNGANSIAVALNAFGAVFSLSTSHIVTGPSTNATHHFVMTFDGTNLKGYVDGVQVVGATSSLGATLINLAVGAEAGNGTISHVAIYDGVVLSSTRVAAHAAVLSGFMETTAARFARLASYAGMTTSTPSNSGQLVGAQDTSGSSMLDALQAVAVSEGGVMFANGTGTLVMQGRYYRGTQTTPDLTIPGKDIDVGTTVTLDDQQIVNQVTATSGTGSTQTYPSDLVLGSVDRYPQSLDLIVTTDGDALLAAQWLASKHATAVPRIGSAVVNLLTSSQAEQIMAAEIGDRWALSSLPTQNWTDMGDFTVEGWSRTLTVTSSGAEWSMTVNLLPWSLFEAALYDTSPYVYDDAGSVYSY